MSWSRRSIVVLAASVIVAVGCGDASPGTVVEGETVEPGRRPLTSAEIAAMDEAGNVVVWDGSMQEMADTAVFEPEGLAALMLGDDDLADLPGWETDDPNGHEATVGALFSGCSAASAMEKIDHSFEWEKNLWRGNELSAVQYVGEAAPGVVAVDLVAAIGTLSDCDVIGFGDVEIATVDVEVPGADAASAAEITVASTDVNRSETGRLVVFSVGQRLSSVSFRWDDDLALEDATMHRLLTLAAAKLAG